MTMQESARKLMLQPFSIESLSQNYRIDVILSKDNSCLKVVFELSAPLKDLFLPVFDPSKAQRKDSLWEHTCFEIFLGQADRSDYWEFNMSPSGDWNVYAFSAYREGMRQEESIHKLLLDLQVLSDEKLRLKTAINLKKLSDFSAIDIGLCAVVEQRGGAKSYWALNHQGAIPDFHAKGSWTRSK